MRTHRETGDKILWVDFGKHPQIVGVSEAENRELLGIILDKYRKSENQVRFHCNWMARAEAGPVIEAVRSLVEARGRPCACKAWKHDRSL